MVVLVRPKFQGNIGAVARSMANFGMGHLVLVEAPPLEDDAFRYSKHARPILESAARCPSLGEALKDADLSVATSGVCNINEKKRERNPLTPRELAEKLRDFEGAAALVFGPEDDGLGMEEITACDLVVTIPTSADYPIMNLSHAASTLFYELFTSSRGLPSRPRKASGEEKELLIARFRELLDATGYPEHKREKTEVMFRRMMGRAVPSKWEFHTMMGVLDRAMKRSPGAGAGDDGHDDDGGDANEGERGIDGDEGTNRNDGRRQSGRPDR
jgi:TrmH family RNA methyltransferase